MEPLSPKQLRELNSVYSSVHPKAEELSEEDILLQVSEEIYNKLIENGLLSESAVSNPETVTKALNEIAPLLAWGALAAGTAVAGDHFLTKGAYRRLIGRRARDFVKMSRQHGDDMHKKMDQEERERRNPGPTGPTGPTGDTTRPVSGPTGPTGPTGSKDPYTPEVVNDPDRYIYNGQEYRFNNGKLEKVKK